MASPFGHAAVGAATAAVVARSLDTPLSPSLWLAAIVAAGFPDLDLVLAMFGKEGPKYHRNASHSLLVLGAGLLTIWLLWELLMPGGVTGVFWAAGAALITHPVLDVVTTGPTLAERGYGIGLLWPISKRRFFVRRPVVNTPELDTVANVKELLVRLAPEVRMIGPPALIVILAAIFL